MSKNREPELKAIIHPEQIDAIRNFPAIKKRVVGRARSRKLLTVYFDTPDRELRRQGVSLCVHKVGRAFVQRVKQMHKGSGGIPVRMEWEGPVPSRNPVISAIKEKRLRRLIRHVGVERLQPVFHKDVQRSSRTLNFEDGSTAFVDLDVGEIVAGDLAEPIREFKLELKTGVPERLFELALEIRKEVPFRLVTENEASCGYALLTQDEPRPRKHVKLSLNKGTSVEQVLTELVQHCLDHLQANEGVVLKTDSAEGVHQMRIALRRLRAALQLFKPSLPDDQYAWAVAEAKWLTAELSAARAWDVFAEQFLVPVVRLYGADHSFDALMAAVEQAKQQSRQRARDAIGTERYTEFLLRLTAWRYCPAWCDQALTDPTARLRDPVGEHYVKLLQKRDRQVRKRGRDIANLSEAALHDLRIAVKRLRYAVDFFEGFYPKKQAKAYRKHLASLQDSLGYLNDVAAADMLLRELAEGGDQALPAPAWAYAGGLTVGWHRQTAIAARQSLVKDMAAFLRTKPFWQRA